MTDDLPTYQQQLLVALRLHDVPGPRIAEALAEVECHVVDTGQSAQDAFGAPDAYARALSSALDARPGRPGSGLMRHPWSRALIAIPSFVGALILVLGLLALGGGGQAPFGLAAWVAVGVGGALLAAVAALLVVTVGLRGDVVHDPRTGASMSPPFPWWAVAVLVAVIPGSLALGFALTAGQTP